MRQRREQSEAQECKTRLRQRGEISGAYSRECGKQCIVSSETRETDDDGKAHVTRHKQVRAGSQEMAQMIYKLPKRRK